MTPVRGEVWWYESAKRKHRPVLVITRQEAIGVLNRLLVVPATTSARDIPTHVPLDESDGMPYTCALALDNTFASKKALLARRITRLGPEKMDQVCRALSYATSC